uniref:hypothetical protein n=1 Tax=Nonomuraea pusilla TaxID=46177 RepID=UPI0006E3FEEA|nr:hypothetical protein [Nonomuraea pusilla]
MGGKLKLAKLGKAEALDFLGRYAFTLPPAPGLRQVRDPYRDDETGDGEDGRPRAPLLGVPTAFMPRSPGL